MITQIKKMPQIVTNVPLTEKVIGCCFRVHNQLGPGLNENIYRNSLRLEFDKLSLRYSSEKQYPVTYNGSKVGHLQMDLVVEDKVVLEIKAVTGILPKVFESQILSYLKVTKIKVGLLVNFGDKSCYIKRYSV